MRVVVGSDHAGYKLKEAVKAFLLSKSYSVDDLGCSSTESVDYPDYARAVARAVAAETGTMGILICGTGIGVSICANKVPGIRAALCHKEYETEMSRNHNDANILCLGARTLDGDEAIHLVETFLNTEFEGGRHLRRVNKIKAMEQ